MKPKSLRDHIADFQHIAAKQRAYRPDTMTLYLFWLDKFAAWAGADATLDDFSSFRLREYRNMLLVEKAYKPSSRASIHAALRSFGQWLVDEERLETNPAVVLGRVKVEKPVPRVAADEDVRAMLAACERLYNPKKRAFARAILSLLTYGGLRRDELRSLHLGDIVPDPTEPGKYKIIVREGKGGHRREVPICQEAVTALDAWKAVRPPSAFPHIFVQSKLGPLSQSGLYSLLRLIAHTADADYANPHSFRHGLITRLLLDPENDIKTVSEIAGHRSTSTTLNVYFHTNARRMRAAADRAGFCLQDDIENSQNPNGEVRLRLTEINE